MGQPPPFCLSKGQEVLQRVSSLFALVAKWDLTDIRATQAQIHDSPRTEINGLQSWSAKGLAGRGVLIDYASFASRSGITIDHFAPHAIILQNVKDIAAEQGVEFRTGDVLFLRTGYAAAYKALSQEERVRVASVREWCGLAQSRDTTEWLWKRQFAAVASDSPGFEVRRECRQSSRCSERVTIGLPY